jgi:hypothetical protein
MSNPRTAALLSAPEDLETPPHTAKTIKPPYVRIVIHPHAWCENVPTRLQDTVSPAQWQSLGRDLQPILLQNHVLDKYLALLVFFCGVAFIVVAATTDPLALVTGDENLRLVLTVGVIALWMVGFQMVHNRVQKWQQRALETACRAAEETAFRSLGWALDGRYQGGAVRCRTPSVIYFNPLHDSYGGNHWEESGEAAVPPYLADQTRELEDSVSRQGYARILLEHYTAFGFQCCPLSLGRLEFFGSLPKRLLPRSDDAWITFWYHLIDCLNQQLLVHRITTVVAWLLVVCLVVLMYLGQIEVLSRSKADTAFGWLFQALVIFVVYKWTWKPDTDILVPEHVHELAQHGLYVECRRDVVPANHCCGGGGGQGIYLYLYPVGNRSPMTA